MKIRWTQDYGWICTGAVDDPEAGEALAARTWAFNGRPRNHSMRGVPPYRASPSWWRACGGEAAALSLTVGGAGERPGVPAGEPACGDVYAAPGDRPLQRAGGPWGADALSFPGGDGADRQRCGDVARPGFKRGESAIYARPGRGGRRWTDHRGRAGGPAQPGGRQAADRTARHRAVERDGGTPARPGRLMCFLPANCGAWRPTCAGC